MNVSQVEVPKVVLPGTAFGSSQNETQLIITSKNLSVLWIGISDAYQEDGWNVVLDHILTNLSFENKVHHQSAVISI